MELEQQPVQYEDPSLMFEDDDGIVWALTLLVRKREANAGL